MTAGVVVGFDGSPPSVQAVEWAALEAWQRGTTLHVVVAADYPGMPATPTRDWTPHLLLSSAQSHLEEGLRLARKRLPEGRLSGDVVTGRAAGMLIDAARTADLLVTGCRSLDPARSAVMGSTSTLAASMAPCPVAVARGATDPACSFTSPVTVGATTSPHSAGALTYAAAAATRRGVPLNIVAAWAVPPTETWEYASTHGDAMAAFARRLREEADQAREQARTQVRREHPDLRVHCDVVEMQPWAALEDGSRRAGLLVVGSRGTGGFEGLRLGSVARAALEHSRCPVVVVPSL
ncbi:universal stress protein [Pedococcus sp.]|uniref:universal stress protein n=1 Tax=Pedococcus sp. TaxID=2860345 RepID=UPI002E0F6C99|nr:universal stress protein [Pedococcus sp.]